MSGKTLGKFISDNAVALVCVPLLVGIHWGWYKLQDPTLSEESRQSKELYKKAVESMNPKYEPSEFIDK